MVRSWIFFPVCSEEQTPAERLEISRHMEIYRMASRVLGYEMAILDRTAKMPSKLQFQILFYPFYIFGIYYLMAIIKYNLLSSFESFHFIHCRCLVETLWWKAPRATETCCSGT